LGNIPCLILFTSLVSFAPRHFNAGASVGASAQFMLDRRIPHATELPHSPQMLGCGARLVVFEEGNYLMQDQNAMTIVFIVGGT